MRSRAPPRLADGPRQLSLLRLNGPGAAAIQAIAAINPGIARRLVSWTPSYAHALSIVLQARRASTPEEAKRLFARDTRLQQAGTADLLREAGFGEAGHLVPLLDRLGRRLHPLDDYRGWARLLADRKVAGFIRSGRRQLTRPRLEALAALHPDLRSERIMGALRSPIDAVALNAVVDTVCRLCPGSSAADVRRSLRETSADIDHWLEDWFGRAVLPPPPFPGSERLVALGTAAEVRELGRTWRNCLSSRLDDAVKGEIAFYRWTDGEPALVSLRPLGELGWLVDEINGPGNEEVDAATRRAIQAELAGWGCFTDDRIEESFHRWQAWSLI